MGFLKEDTLKKARDFIREALKGATLHPIIVYHGDGDGCCAGFFLKEFINRDTDLYWVATPDFDFQKAESYLMDKNFSLYIFLDMPVDNRKEMILKLSLKAPVFIYDHHRFHDVADFIGDILYINPLLEHDLKDYPAALFGWELLEQKGLFEKEILYMALFTESWLDKLDIFDDIPENKREKLKLVAKMIHSNFLVQDMPTTHYDIDLLLSLPKGKNGIDMERLEDMKEYEILRNIYRLIENEKAWLLNRISNEIKRISKPRYILKKIESKMRLSGLIASELRWHYSHIAIAIWQRWKDRYYCELRRGRYCTVDLASLVELIGSQVQLLTGGGHPEAAAFTAEREGFFKALDILKANLR